MKRWWRRQRAAEHPRQCNCVGCAPHLTVVVICKCCQQCFVAQQTTLAVQYQICMSCISYCPPFTHHNEFEDYCNDLIAFYEYRAMLVERYAATK